MASETTTTGHETDLSTTQVEAEQSHSGASGIAALGIDGSLLLAQIVNFLLLLLILRFALYGPIVKLLRERREKIESGLKMAEQSQADAQLAEEQKHQVISKAKTQAAQIIEQAEAKAMASALEIKNKANQEADKLLTQAKEQIEPEKSQLMAEAEADLGELIAVATQKVVGSADIKVDESQISSALSEAKGI